MEEAGANFRGEREIFSASDGTAIAHSFVTPFWKGHLYFPEESGKGRAEN